MGQRMPLVPHIYGNDCIRGFPAGKTPKYIYARFSLMVKCPDAPPIFYPIPPNDRVFKLTQDPEDACWWWYRIDPWYVGFEYRSFPNRTIFVLLHEPLPAWYFHIVEPLITDEGHVFHTDLDECLWDVGATGGIATVTWIHEATDILESINMQRADDLFMEMRPLENDNKVYKFCRRRDATNISILFQPD